MQKISRATDTIWSQSAFDPRKPVDPDWASRPPASVLRSGDERDLFMGSPEAHDHSGDAMRWGSEDGPEEDYREPDFNGGAIGSDTVVPGGDLRDIGLHQMNLVSGRAGRLDGSNGHYVEYPNGSSVSHYYTYHPLHDSSDRWSLQSMHSLLRDSPVSYHPTFRSAITHAPSDRAHLEAQADREYPV